MSALSIQPTFPIFTETDGLPLENGYIWIGAANLDPQGNPINVYWDAALTIAAPQPIRTLNGYPSRSGTPARLYVNSDYSIRVQDKNASTVYSAPQATERYSDFVVSMNAETVVYDPPFTNAVSTNVESKLAQTVSVKDFGAVGDGVTEDSTAFINAIASLPDGGVVHVPAGNYKITTTVALDNDITILGEGTASAILGNCYADNTDAINGLFAAKNKSNVALDSLKILPFQNSGITRCKFILCDNVQIKNCYVDGDLTGGDIGSYPIWLAGCSTAKVINHTSYNIRDHVYICRSNWNVGTTCGQVDVIDSYFENVNLGSSHGYPTGVYVYFADYTNVTGCTFKNISPSLAGVGHTGYGVYEGDGVAIEVNVKNCNFKLDVASVGDTVGVLATRSDIVSVVGCSFLGTTSNKFSQGFAYSSSTTLIQSNNFEHCKVSVFLVRGEIGRIYSNWSVIGNTIANCEIAIRVGAGATTGAENVNVSNNTISNCTQNGILFNLVTASGEQYAIVCTGNLIRNANTSNTATVPFESAINVFGGTPTGLISGNFVINDIGVGYARYGIAIINSDYPMTVTNTNMFSGMITGAVLNNQAAPTTGSWNKGNTRWNWNATSGQPMGYVCTVSGTPGTWTAMPNLT